MKTKVFLGGSCNNSTWRDKLIPLLIKNNINYFNPVVEDWTPECQKEEYRQKENECNVHLYVITKEMKGTFSIAEAVDSAWQDRVITIFQVIPEGFDSAELKSLKAVSELISKRGGYGYISNDFDFILTKILYIDQLRKIN